jgi:ubiquinone/menaquinone biosynthesis C-methylase UbiE
LGQPAPSPSPSIDHPLLSRAREESLQPDALVAALNLARTATVADIGAGPGLFTLPLARALPGGRVIATDLRRDLLDIAAARAARAGLNNVETRVVKAQQPGLERETIDVAFLCQVDHYLADRVGYFASLKRALKPQGRLVLVNTLRLRDAALAAARSAGFELVQQWQVGALYFAATFTPERHR